MNKADALEKAGKAADFWECFSLLDKDMIGLANGARPRRELIFPWPCSFPGALGP